MVCEDDTGALGGVGVTENTITEDGYAKYGTGPGDCIAEGHRSSSWPGPEPRPSVAHVGRPEAIRWSLASATRRSVNTYPLAPYRNPSSPCAVAPNRDNTKRHGQAPTSIVGRERPADRIMLDSSGPSDLSFMVVVSGFLSAQLQRRAQGVRTPSVAVKHTRQPAT